jgi:tRNA (cmo5U34)-methyltransferase
VELRQGNFARIELPRCDGVAASVALHHVRTRRSKLALYTRIAQALRPDGLFVSADCMLPTAPALVEQSMQSWRRHLRAAYSAREAAAYLRSWSKEDRYQRLDVELSLVSRAGLIADVAWRRKAFAVVVGRRPGRRRG